MISELPDDPEQLKTLLRSVQGAQAGSDKQVNVLQGRVKELESEIKRLESLKFVEADGLARIQRIEKAAAEREAARELRYYAKDKARDLGIDPEIIEGRKFADAQEVDAYLGKVSNIVTLAAEGEVNKRLLSAEKPQSGNAGPPRVNAFLAGIAKEAGRTRSDGF